MFKNIYISYAGRPRNTLLSLASVPTENKDLNLSCTTSSKPPAEITWLDKDGNVLQNSSRYYIRTPASVFNGFETQVQSIFVIINIQINQTGLLKCRAENLLGSETLNTSVIVQCKFFLLFWFTALMQNLFQKILSTTILSITINKYQQLTSLIT